MESTKSYKERFFEVKIWNLQETEYSLALKLEIKKTTSNLGRNFIFSPKREYLSDITQRQIPWPRTCKR